MKPKSYIRGRPARAAVSLVDYLGDRGVVAAVGYNGKSQFPRKIDRLIVQFQSGDLNQVPSEWQGYAVVIERPGHSD